jgi:hypothetical protein
VVEMNCNYRDDSDKGLNKFALVGYNTPTEHIRQLPHFCIWFVTEYLYEIQKPLSLFKAEVGWTAFGTPRRIIACHYDSLLLKVFIKSIRR